MTTKEFQVEGMTCGHCVAAVTTEVRKLPGVSEVEVILETGQLIVTAESIDDDAIKAAVDEAGYALR